MTTKEKREIRRRRRRLLVTSFKTSGTDKIIGSFLIVFFIAALIVLFTEPTIHTYYDSMWYCFVALATIGFGDITATMLIPRLVTVVLWVYGVVVLAIVTAVLAGFFMDLAKLKVNQSVKEFLGELERLPELSKEELEDLSKRAKKFNRK